MRQIVSVMTDDGIAYFIDDGNGAATQIAQVINPGLNVPDVIQLGVNLGDVLRIEPMNGTASRHVTTKAQRALPPASSTPKHVKPSKLKAKDRVYCPRCPKVYVRHSMFDHLTKRHGVAPVEARLIARTARRVDEPETDGRKESTPKVERGADGRKLVPRHAATDTWPRATADDVLAEIRKHPEGISTRELAVIITDTTGRGRQTIGNMIQTLRGRGEIESVDGYRPHHKSGIQQPTMLVRVKR